MTAASNRLDTGVNGFGTLEQQAGLPSLHRTRTPRLARRLSRVLAIALVLLPLLLVFVPWTQTVHGTGKVVAFHPVQRPQYVVSPIEGRIKKWYVVEGDRVKGGQRIVEMVDNDPELERRLLAEEQAIVDRLRAAEARVRDIENRVANVQASWELAKSVQAAVLQQAKLQLQTFQFDLIGLEAEQLSMQQNYDRIRSLVNSEMGGLASVRDLEVATQNLNTATAKVNAQKLRIQLAEQSVKVAQDSLEKMEADRLAQISQERASLRAAEAEVALIRREKTQIEVRIARQRAQYVDSPVDGTVFRLLAAGEAGGILVRPGERLAIIVPDIKSENNKHGLTGENYPGIVAELQIDGNDLPLIRKGDAVRLQFEGWPAVQFVGWPSVAVGTFGGRVYLVDPTADDKGYFRILVEPDPSDQPWPDQDYLRQGVRAQGWVVLNRVSLGWELWRRLNTFPPVREVQDPKKGQTTGPVKLNSWK